MKLPVDIAKGLSDEIKIGGKTCLKRHQDKVNSISKPPKKMLKTRATLKAFVLPLKDRASYALPTWNKMDNGLNVGGHSKI